MQPDALETELSMLEFYPGMRKNPKKKAMQRHIDIAVENLIAGRVWYDRRGVE